MPTVPERLRNPLLLLALPWSAVIALWLIDALAAPNAGTPATVDTLAAWAAVTATAAVVALQATRLWRAGRSGRILLAVLVLAGVTYFTGLGQEVTGRYFGDEGIYLAQALRINQHGQLLRPWFIYPHLLFYLDAVALWLASALGPIVPWLARVLYGVTEPSAIAPLVTRGVTALLGFGAVAPAYVAARRIAGEVAAPIAGALLALCPLFIQVAHLNISDVAGAFFAAMAFMQCALLLDAETRRDYLLAGLWSGLAAGGKYPAGVVAIAVAGVWLGWRLRRRDLRFGLLWAAAAAIAGFVGTTPSFLAFPGAAFSGQGTDVTFGFRQYAQAGWSGVVRASNVAYYLGQLRGAFGLPALVLGLAGIPWLNRTARCRLLWLAPFPVAYLALMLAMHIALPRNLLPVLPALAALAGAGISAWVVLAARRIPPTRLRNGVAVLVVTICLALPIWKGVVSTIRFARPSTRELAAAWIPAHLPPGSALVQEVYTPLILPEHLYPSVRTRFVVRLPPDQLRDPRFDFIFVASAAYNRFFHLEALDDRFEEGGRERYEQIFETFPPVKDWVPGTFRAGPVLRLFELDPEHPPWGSAIHRRASDLLTRAPEMRPDDGGPIVFRSPGQWALAKGYLEPGRYTVTVDADLTAAGGAGRGGVQVMTREGEEIDVNLFVGGASTTVDLPRRAKYFVYLRLPEGSVLRGVRIERSPGDLRRPEPMPARVGADEPEPSTSASGARQVG